MDRLLSWPSRLLLFSYLLGLLFPVNALYFYLDSTTPKCFYEELPKDTLVVGESNPSGGPLSFQLIYGRRDQKLTFKQVNTTSKSITHRSTTTSPTLNSASSFLSTKSSVPIIVSFPNKAPRVGASRSVPQTPATTVSASSLLMQHPHNGLLQGRHWEVSN